MTFGRGLLIAGGLAAGGYVLYRIFAAPSTVKRSSAPGSSYVTQAGDVISGLESLAGFIAGSKPSPSGGNGTGSGEYISTSSGSYGSAGAYANYAAADANPGTALPEGVYGPPVPAPADGLTGDFTGTDVNLA